MNSIAMAANISPMKRVATFIPIDDREHRDEKKYEFGHGDLRTDALTEAEGQWQPKG